MGSRERDWMWIRDDAKYNGAEDMQSLDTECSSN